MRRPVGSGPGCVQDQDEISKPWMISLISANNQVIDLQVQALARPAPATQALGPRHQGLQLQWGNSTLNCSYNFRPHVQGRKLQRASSSTCSGKSMRIVRRHKRPSFRLKRQSAGSIRPNYTSVKAHGKFTGATMPRGAT